MKKEHFPAKYGHQVISHEVKMHLKEKQIPPTFAWFLLSKSSSWSFDSEVASEDERKSVREECTILDQGNIIKRATIMNKH